MGIYTDITDIKRQEMRLRESDLGIESRIDHFHGGPLDAESHGPISSLSKNDVKAVRT